MKKQNFFQKVLLKLFGKIIADLIEQKIKSTVDDVKTLISWKGSIDVQLTPEKIQTFKDPSLVISPDERFQIRIEKCPNKDYKTFHVSVPLYEKGRSIYNFDFPSIEDDATPEVKKITAILYNTKICTGLFLKPFSISFIKTGAADWAVFIPKIIEGIFSFLNDKYPAPTNAEASTEEKVVSERDKIDIRDDNEIPRSL